MISTHKVTEIHYTQLLDPEGNLCADGQLPEIAKDFDKLRELYSHMVLVRAFDQKMIALQRTGQVGTYPSCLGQEAVGTAMGALLKRDDVFVPYYRDQATQLMRGVTMKDLLLYWGGDERGSDFGACREDFPISVPIATQLTHAVGVASAIKIRKQPRAVMVTCGDGGTSRGEFYEALNLAGVWQLPIVVVIVNNQWAISVPLDIQTAAETIAHKALAAGIRSERVDGNDILALHKVIGNALDVAHHNRGPTLIEAVTYRLGDHTTADDASRYRDHQSVKSHWRLEPIKRLQAYLQANNAWSEKEETQLLESCKQKIEASVKAYLDMPKAAPEALIDHLYNSLPAELVEQRTHLIAKGGRL